jgi:hypothetical protein
VIFGVTMVTSNDGNTGFPVFQQGYCLNVPRFRCAETRRAARKPGQLPIPAPMPRL